MLTNAMPRVVAALALCALAAPARSLTVTRDVDFVPDPNTVGCSQTFTIDSSANVAATGYKQLVTFPVSSFIAQARSAASVKLSNTQAGAASAKNVSAFASVAPGF